MFEPFKCSGRALQEPTAQANLKSRQKGAQRPNVLTSAAPVIGLLGCLKTGTQLLPFMEGFSHMQGRPQLPKPPTREKWGATKYQMDSFAKAVALYNKNWNTSYTLKEAEREYRQMDDNLST